LTQLASVKPLVRAGLQLADPRSYLDTRGDSQVAERFAKVVLDRAHGDEQLSGDVSVGVSLGDEAGDLVLSPVVCSSTRAPSANAFIPKWVTISYAVRSSLRASTRRA
jgi:hypothetical protein